MGPFRWYNRIFHEGNKRTERGVGREQCSINYVFAEKERLSTQEAKRAELQQKKKPILLRELENELRHLDELNAGDFKGGEDPYFTDQTLEKLQIINRWLSSWTSTRSRSSVSWRSASAS